MSFWMTPSKFVVTLWKFPSSNQEQMHLRNTQVGQVKQNKNLSSISQLMPLNITSVVFSICYLHLQLLNNMDAFYHLNWVFIWRSPTKACKFSKSKRKVPNGIILNNDCKHATSQVCIGEEKSLQNYFQLGDIHKHQPLISFTYWSQSMQNVNFLAYI